MTDFKFPYKKDQLSNVTLDTKGGSVPDFINEIVWAFGVDVTIRWDQNREVMVYDLNTGAKSHLHIVYEPHLPKNGWAWKARYDKVFSPNTSRDLMDVLWAVFDCMHGRDYVSDQWLKALVHYGILEIRTKTVTEIVRR